MRNQFQIGEMAAIHHTTIKTLRYYDEIGLFKPAFVNTSNGYRYYSAEQFERLNTIQYLKQMGLSLRAIQDHLDSRSIDDFRLLLENQAAQIDQQIASLQKIKQRFRNRIQDLDLSQRPKKIGQPFVTQIGPRQVIKLERPITTNDELEVALRHLENQAQLEATIFIGGVGLTIDIQHIRQHQFNEYGSIFMLTNEDYADQRLVSTIQAGKYVCIYHNGNHSQSAQYYDQLLAYLEEQQFQIIGDAVERTIIDQYISRDPADYLTEIQIPISN